MATGRNNALRLSGNLLRPPYFFPAGLSVTKMPAFKSTSISRPKSLTFNSVEKRRRNKCVCFSHATNSYLDKNGRNDGHVLNVPEIRVDRARSRQASTLGMVVWP